MNSKHSSFHGKNVSTNEFSADRDIYKFKVIMLGNISVGKTAIMNRITENKFSSDYNCTVGVETKTKPIQIDKNTLAELQIWDTCGEERFKSVTRQYYRDKQGIVLVFDLTDKKSFNALNKWIEDVKTYADEEFELIVVGNKFDLIKDSEEREITQEEIENLMGSFDLTLEYIEVSAKEDFNINDLFLTLATNLVKKADRNDNQTNSQFKKSMASGISTSVISYDKSGMEIVFDKPYKSKKKNKGCC